MGLGLSSYAPYVIYIGCFAVAILVLFYRTEIGLFFLVPLTPWQTVWVKVFKYPLGKDLIDILMASMLIGMYLRKRPSEKTPYLAPISLLMIITFLGVLLGSGLSMSHEMRFWKNFAYMPLLYLITFNVMQEEKDIKILIFLMGFSMLANDLYFRDTFEFFKSEHFYYSSRVTTFADLGPNEMASFVSQGTLMLMGIWLAYKDRLSRLFIAVILLGNIYVILYSYSRGSYLAVLTSMAFLGLIKDRRILLALLIFGVLWTAVLPNSVVERINMTENEEGQFDNSSSERLAVWVDGINTFAQNPMGIGFDKFQSLGFGEKKRASSQYAHTDAHNMYVKMLVESGIQGLAIYVLLYLFGLKSGWDLYKSGNNGFLNGMGLGFMAATIVSMMCNLFGQDWLLFSVTSYYWVFWALVAKANVIARRKIDAPPAKQFAWAGHQHA